MKEIGGYRNYWGVGIILIVNVDSGLGYCKSFFVLVMVNKVWDIYKGGLVKFRNLDFRFLEELR